MEQAKAKGEGGPPEGVGIYSQSSRAKPTGCLMDGCDGCIWGGRLLMGVLLL